jgi:sugar transferase (PEP-CTERM/EpsH1 system associated)
MSVPVTVAHVVYRFDFGGLENGIVNLINHMPAERCRHAIVCLTGYSDFAARIRTPGVRLFALQKRPGKDVGCYLRFARLMRELRPDIVHTRNLGTLDMQVIASLQGIRARVHGEHGWDVNDLRGDNPKTVRLRRVCRRFVHRYVTTSRDLEAYLLNRVRVPASRVRQIYNGVDTELFRPRQLHETPPWPGGFSSPDTVVIGSVGRMEAVKNPLGLLSALRRLVDAVPEGRKRLRFAVVGGGPLLAELRDGLRAAGLDSITWLPGARSDVAAIVRHLDIFVLPSLNEGISNTILDAMASGIPVVAARVGGNPELVRDGETGLMYSAGDESELNAQLQRYVEDAATRQRHGARARAVAVANYTLESMVRAYLEVYQDLLDRRR